jgi:hypothetical protein
MTMANMTSPESNAQKIEKIKSLMVANRMVTQPSITITLRPPSPPQVPILGPSWFEKLPDELLIIVLTHALRVHRITPRITMLGLNSRIRRLSLVSQRFRRVAIEAYFKYNVVASMRVGRIRPPADNTALDHHFQLPSKIARPWIRHLEMELNVESAQKASDRMHNKHGLQVPFTAALLEEDLGVLLRSKHGQPTRTAWQADLKPLESLKIIILCPEEMVRKLRSRLRKRLKNLAIDLRTSTFELRIQSNTEAPAIDPSDNDVVAIHNAFKSLMGLGK